MSIEISSPTSKQVRSDDQRNMEYRQKNTSPPNHQSTKASSLQDAVHITDRVHDIKRAQKMVQNLPIVDTKKVEEIKLAISNGQYQVNSEAIAGKIIAFEQIHETETE